MTYRARRKMKFYAALLSILGIAMVVLPGVAGQNDSSTPVGRLAAMQEQLGFALDPHQATDLSITLPKGFAAFDVSADPFAS
jgi:hypothetical protein